MTVQQFGKNLPNSPAVCANPYSTGALPCHLAGLLDGLGRLRGRGCDRQRHSPGQVDELALHLAGRVEALFKRRVGQRLDRMPSCRWILTCMFGDSIARMPRLRAARVCVAG